VVLKIDNQIYFVLFFYFFSTEHILFTEEGSTLFEQHGECSGEKGAVGDRRSVWQWRPLEKAQRLLHQGHLHFMQGGGAICKEQSNGHHACGCACERGPACLPKGLVG
jgi:hypothetical protein